MIFATTPASAIWCALIAAVGPLVGEWIKDRREGLKQRVEKLERRVDEMERGRRWQ